MAASDYVVRTQTGTAEVVDAGADLLVPFANSVASSGSGITYSAGTFTLGETGKFLVLYSVQWGTTDTTANERTNAKTTLTLGTTELLEGYATGYLRRSGGSQEFINFGAAVVDVTSTASTDDDLQVRIERIDDSTIGTVSLIADRSGITIIKLDDTWNYGLYRSSSAWTSSGTDHAATTSSIGTTDEQDGTVFARTSNTVAVNTSNLVIAIYSQKSEDSTPTGRSEYQGRITRGGTIHDASYSQTYGPRVTDNSDWGGMSAICVWEGTGSSQDCEAVVVSRESGGETFESTFQLIELPAAATGCIVSNTTAAGNINAAATDYVWNNAADYIDTADFTYSSSQANIDVDNAGDYLVMAGMGAETTFAGTRAVPALGISVNSTQNEQTGNSAYNRNNGTAEYAAVNCGTLLTGLSANDSIAAENDRIGTVTTSRTVVAGMGVVRLSSLFANDVEVTAGTDALSITEQQASIAIGVTAGTETLTLTEQAAGLKFEATPPANRIWFMR